MSTTTLGEPVELSRESTRDHWNTVIASTVGWTLDSFDYFVVVMVLTEIANDFHRTNAEIALRLALSVHTVERHVANLYRKIDARGRADATAFAVRQGIA